MQASRWWWRLCAALALLAVAGWFLPRHALDWQPSLAWSQPWRWWSAAFVHLSALHLVANLLGCVVVALFGAAAAVPARAALAWFVAWPLTHLALLLQPSLAHYGGLSGVLHAGVAAAATWLLAEGRGLRRFIGAAVLAGLAAKLAFEAPWRAVLRHVPGWDIAVAPGAHAAGLAAGLLCAAAACALKK